jgi:hypothetical protein
MKLHLVVFKEDRVPRSVRCPPAPATGRADDASGVYYVSRFRLEGRGDAGEVSARSVGELAACLRGKLLESEPAVRGGTIAEYSIQFPGDRPKKRQWGFAGAGQKSGARTGPESLNPAEKADFFREMEEAMIRQPL